MNLDDKPVRSLREIEIEVLEEGRDWMRRRLEQRLQEEAATAGFSPSAAERRTASAK